MGNVRRVSLRYLFRFKRVRITWVTFTSIESGCQGKIQRSFESVISTSLPMCYYVSGTGTETCYSFEHEYTQSLDRGKEEDLQVTADIMNI